MASAFTESDNSTCDRISPSTFALVPSTMPNVKDKRIVEKKTLLRTVCEKQIQWRIHFFEIVQNQWKRIDISHIKANDSR